MEHLKIFHLSNMFFNPNLIKLPKLSSSEDKGAVVALRKRDSSKKDKRVEKAMPLIKMLRGLESVMNGIVDCIPRGAAASRTLLIIRRHRIHYPGRGTTKRSSRNSSIFGYHQYFAGHSFPFLLLPSQQRKTKLIIGIEAEPRGSDINPNRVYWIHICF